MNKTMTQTREEWQTFADIARLFREQPEQLVLEMAKREAWLRRQFGKDYQTPRERHQYYSEQVRAAFRYVLGDEELS